MFNIDVLNGNPDFTISDERIGLTILEVFNHFFSTRQNVAVYVCDSLDDRQLARRESLIFGSGSLMMAPSSRKMTSQLWKVLKSIIR